MYLPNIALLIVTKIASLGLSPFEALFLRAPVLSLQLNIYDETVYKPDTQTYIEITKRKTGVNAKGH
jgi:hypothetical protein